jgi:hypothetical protein
MLPISLPSIHEYDYNAVIKLLGVKNPKTSQKHHITPLLPSNWTGGAKMIGIRIPFRSLEIVKGGDDLLNRCNRQQQIRTLLGMISW